MNHQQRLEIATKLKNEILETYKENIVAIAIYGSVARNEDEEFSDLEMWVATNGIVPSQEKLFLIGELPVEILFGSEEEFISDAAQMHWFWPTSADNRRSYLILYTKDKSNFLAKLEKAAQKAPKNKADVEDALADVMLLTYIQLGKLKNSWNNADKYGVLAAGREIVTNAAYIVALANRTFYKGKRKLFQTSYEMSLQPDNYRELVGIAGGFDTTDNEAVYNASLQLWESLEKFVQNQGIDWKSNVSEYSFNWSNEE